MQLTFSLLVLLGSAVAYPSASPPSHGPPDSKSSASPYDNWQPAGPGDLRSPCPWMNAFSNHNFLPHNGRGITIPMMQAAFKKFGNFGPDVSTLLGTLALSIVGPGAKSFTLRSDFALGDDHSFNYKFFSEAAAYFHNPTINVTDAAEARLARMTTMMKLNPKFSLDAGAETRSFIEQAFYLSIFGDPYLGVARSDWVLSWFFSERLPTHLGWTPRSQETNLTTLLPMAERVKAATPAKVVPPGK